MNVDAAQVARAKDRRGRLLTKFRHAAKRHSEAHIVFMRRFAWLETGVTKHGREHPAARHRARLASVAQREHARAYWRMDQLRRQVGVLDKIIRGEIR